MELQLGLSLPTRTPIKKEIDLNDNYSSFECSMERYGSSLSSDDGFADDENYVEKWRRFDEADSSAVGPKRTLPLLLWKRDPNDEDDDPREIQKCSPFNVTENKGGEDWIVGWPPISSYRKRKNLCRQDNNGRRVNYPTVENRGVGGRWSSRYVKVQMEGVVITKKINMSFLHYHQSYEMLTSSLVGLFGRGEDSINGYTLTYQDKEGDWLLARDVPWRTFIQSIQRLKLIKGG
ncbi:hypothetical protein Nepgr_006383 [Nepenthes gracilis]|uniref:Auxin-responsive protein n=1 Tax=Nepenthes gracilis TaxID=150966 RepID=A0AAD3XHB6_NEPGR|nr:hypothetical protein Nepgr_006383 [Nepenthes gracilis]